MQIPQYLIDETARDACAPLPGGRHRWKTCVKNSSIHRRRLFAFCYKTLKPLVKEPKEVFSRACALWLRALEINNFSLFCPDSLENPPKYICTGALVSIYKHKTSTCFAMQNAIFDLQSAINTPLQCNFDLAHFDIITLKINAADLAVIKKIAQQSYDIQAVCPVTLNELSLLMTSEWHTFSNKGTAGYLLQQKLIANLKSRIMRGKVRVIELDYYHSRKELVITSISNVDSVATKVATELVMPSQIRLKNATIQEAESFAKFTNCPLNFSLHPNLIHNIPTLVR